MSDKQMIHIPHFCYQDCFERECQCDLFVIPREDDVHVIVATERPGNEGMSVTNAAEQVYKTACETFASLLKKEDCIFVEHYDLLSYVGGGKGETEDSWDVVTFASEFMNPAWKRLTREKFEELLGSKEAVTFYNQNI